MNTNNRQKQPLWAESWTHYRIERCALGTSNGQPSGRIICEGCGEAAFGIDRIDHRASCPNARDA